MMKMIEFLVQYELLRLRFGFEVDQMFGPPFVYRFVRSFLRRCKLVLFQSVEEHCFDFWGPLFVVLIVLLIAERILISLLWCWSRWRLRTED
jgi:hypothetical protein